MVGSTLFTHRSKVRWRFLHAGYAGGVLYPLHEIAFYAVSFPATKVFLAKEFERLLHIAYAGCACRDFRGDNVG
jgi:hypothetical protein